MLSIVAWIWRGHDPQRVFLPEHVSTLARSIKRTLSVPHRFVCVSDETEGFGPDVEVVKTPPAAAALASLRNPGGTKFPSCYQRLWNFSSEARDALGERIFAIDVDLVVLRDLAPLLKRTEDFVGWRPRASWGNSQRVGGGMYMLTTGTHTHVFDDFKGPESIAAAVRAGYKGSDQAWISYKLGRQAALWPRESGLYSIRDMQNGRAPLPRDAIAVQFNGSSKPWSSQLKFVKEHWR